MKDIATKILSMIIVAPILLLIALVAWLGGAGGGPKSLISFVLGVIVLVVLGVPALIVFGVLSGGFYLIARHSPHFKKRIKAMEKTLKRD